MSKKVMIPNDGMKPFVVMHNGEKYVYAPGQTVDVPDGVALEIEEYQRKKHPGEAIPPFAGGGVQPDWNQNDPNALDFVKNRTHYSEVKYSAIVEEQTVSVYDGEWDESVVSLGLLEEGKTYTVVLDGNSYACVAWRHDESDSIFIGNGSYYFGLEGKGDIVPFLVEMWTYDDTVFAGLYADDGEHTFCIEGELESVHRIDEKYLSQTTIAKLETNETISKIFINEHKSTADEWCVYYDSNDKTLCTKTPLSFSRILCVYRLNSPSISSLPAIDETRKISSGQEYSIIDFLENAALRSHTKFYILSLNVNGKEVTLPAQMTQDTNGHYTWLAQYIDNETHYLYIVEWKQRADIAEDPDYNNKRYMPYDVYITRIK